jgi:poly(3-hydroxybutyrate) depolymerase
VLYHLYELSHAAMSPARAAANSTQFLLRNPFNPLSYTNIGRNAAAAAELMERTTRRYKKPTFNLPTTEVKGQQVAITEEIVWKKPFCNLIHFKKNLPKGSHSEPRVLLVAPLSGHFATLLRGTVEALLPHSDVYITDWLDARFVSMREGPFTLDDYIDYVIEMIQAFRGDVHVMAVCQPGVPVLSAIALMETNQNPFVPRSVTLKGSPIDTRISPTAVNTLAEEKGINWFRSTVITTVPWPNRGHGRLVYPGFLQLTGFMAMNLDRHMNAHKELFVNLVKGDGDSVEKHKEFYDEYLAVMDLSAEYYLQTIDQVFVQHQLPKGEMKHRGAPIDLSAIHRVSLMTVEGEKDDITGAGQTEAAIHLCKNVPRWRKQHYTQPGVGHYGIFNGSRYRKEVLPRVIDFIADHDVRGSNMHYIMHRMAGERNVEEAPQPLSAEEAAAAVQATPDTDSARLSAMTAKRALRLKRGRARLRQSARRGLGSIPRGL